VRLKAKKPLVVVVEDWQRRRYITAIAADHIVAQQSSLVGSIGVLFQYPSSSRRREREEVVSRLKRRPWAFSAKLLPPEPAARRCSVKSDTGTARRSSRPASLLATM